MTMTVAPGCVPSPSPGGVTPASGPDGLGQYVGGGLDRRAGDVATGADAEVGQPRPDAPADDAEEVAGVKFVEQAEGVAPADEDALGLLDGGDGVGVAVGAVEDVAGVDASFRHLGDVAVMVAQGVGDEEEAADGAEEGP